MKSLSTFVPTWLLLPVVFRAQCCWRLQCPVLWAGYSTWITWWPLALPFSVIRLPKLVDWVHISSRTCFCIYTGRANRNLITASEETGSCVHLGGKSSVFTIELLLSRDSKPKPPTLPHMRDGSEGRWRGRDAADCSNSRVSTGRNSGEHGEPPSISTGQCSNSDSTAYQQYHLRQDSSLASVWTVTSQIMTIKWLNAHRSVLTSYCLFSCAVWQIARNGRVADRRYFKLTNNGQTKSLKKIKASIECNF